MNTSAIIQTLEVAKMAIQEVEDMLELPTEDIHLNKRQQRLLELIQRPQGAHIDHLADELCVEKESVRSLVSKVTRKTGFKAVCHNGVYSISH